MRGNELVLRPVKENTSGEFAEQILADLIRQGYSCLLYTSEVINISLGVDIL